jgi:triacylglycerol esterase/lipase EstA (alpha/beta hydrolase family)
MGMRATTIRIVTAVAASLALGAGVLTAAPAQAVALPTLPAAGANDWSCKPTRGHPSPVVIVHGTFGDSKSLLDRLSWRLHTAGYCVFALDYGNRATGPIEASAKQLKAFVTKVLGTTGSAKVSLVGHSQGGMMPRYYIKFLGGAAKVDDLVGLSPSNHGTSNPLLLTPGLNYLCPSCLQQQTGSAFLRHLNAGDETPGTVSYTNIVTRYDAVVLPFTSGYLSGARTTNLRLQSKCPLDLSGHLLIPMDGPAIRLTLNALGRPGPASPSYRPSCLP